MTKLDKLQVLAFFFNFGLFWPVLARSLHRAGLGWSKAGPKKCGPNWPDPFWPAARMGWASPFPRYTPHDSTLTPNFTVFALVPSHLVPTR